MSYVIGLDFGTDSVRAVLVDAQTGHERTQAVFAYPRWKAGLHCDPARNQFRQHPLDYIEGLETTIRQVLATAPDVPATAVRGIGIDTTGSTPVAVGADGVPLGLTPAFADNPNAHFVLWKDHTAVAEADEINQKARTWAEAHPHEGDYTRYAGGIYSSEWFWAKILHITRTDEAVASAAHSWLEHCDYISLLLTGTSLTDLKRSRCAAGHKALWHERWGGLLPEAFLAYLDPRLAGLRNRLFTDTYTADTVAGTLSAEWATRLGLTPETLVAVGTFDAHAGGIGGQIEAWSMVKVMGTSTCDMVVAPTAEVGDTLVRGICGQVDGSIVPGMLGLEAGQSAFGDLLAWFRQVLEWPLRLIDSSGTLSAVQKEALKQDIAERLMAELTTAAQAVDPAHSSVLALDWVNGRRTPDANQLLKGAIVGLSMGSGAPEIFRALVEAICYGSRLIVERFEAEGIPIRQVIGLGGVAKKSPFVMQTLADVLNRPIRIATSEQAPALGAAMYAAVAAGIHPDVPTAMQQMGSGFDATYTPIPANATRYNRLFSDYQALGDFIEVKGEG
jgi:L-ribulokinase